jgi:hypothetical protein
MKVVCELYSHHCPGLVAKIVTDVSAFNPYPFPASEMVAVIIENDGETTFLYRVPQTVGEA